MGVNSAGEVVDSGQGAGGGGQEVDRGVHRPYECGDSAEGVRVLADFGQEVELAGEGQFV